MLFYVLARASSGDPTHAHAMLHGNTQSIAVLRSLADAVYKPLARLLCSRLILKLGQQQKWIITVTYVGC
jgi:hypothetical protein